MNGGKQKAIERKRERESDENNNIIIIVGARSHGDKMSADKYHKPYWPQLRILLGLDPHAENVGMRVAGARLPRTITFSRRPCTAIHNIIIVSYYRV